AGGDGAAADRLRDPRLSCRCLRAGRASRQRAREGDARPPARPARFAGAAPVDAAHARRPRALRTVRLGRHEAPRAADAARESGRLRMSLRADLAKIAEHVPPAARVLDIGCGQGELMAELRDRKKVDARGMEIDPELVERAVA